MQGLRRPELHRALQPKVAIRTAKTGLFHGDLRRPVAQDDGSGAFKLHILDRHGRSLEMRLDLERIRPGQQACEADPTVEAAVSGERFQVDRKSTRLNSSH